MTSIASSSRILSLDASIGTTGYAFAIDGKIIKAGFNDINESDFDGDRLLSGELWITELIKQLNPDLLLIEDYFFQSNHAMGASLNPKIRAIYELVSRKSEPKIPYLMIPPPAWKKAVAGRSRPTNEQKLKWKAKANKLFITEALETRLNIKFPTKIVSPFTGRKCDFKYDVSDAIGILIYYFLQHNIRYSIDTNIWDFEVVK